MAVTAAELEVILRAKDEMSKVLKDARGNVEQHSKGIVGSLGDIAKQAIGFAAGGALLGGIKAVVGELGSFVTEAGNAQKIGAQTEAVLKSTGGVAGLTADAIGDLATSLSEVTMFEDDAIQAGENMLLTFTNIGKDVFPAATETMLDMAQAMGGDIKGTAIQLGKALQDPINGVSALSRVGVNFSDAQKAVIKSLVESGDAAGAQALILKELQVEFGGSAKAAGQTFAGQMTVLQNKLGNVKESIGTAILPALTQLATGLSTTLSNPAVTEGIAKLTTALSTGLGNAITFITSAAQKAAPIFQAVFDVLSGAGQDIPWEDMFPPWAARIMLDISKAVDGFRATFATMTKGVGGAAKTLFPQIGALVKTHLGMVAQVWGAVIPGLLKTIQVYFTAIAPLVKTVIGIVWNTIKNALTLIQSIWTTLWPALRTVFETVFATVQRVVTTVVPIVQRLIEAMAPVFERAFGIIQKVVSDVTPVVKRLIEDMAKFVNEQVGKITDWLEENGPLIDAAMKVITSAIDVALKAIKVVWDAVWPYLQIVIETVWKAIKVIIDTTLGVIMGIVKAALQLISGDFEGAWETIKATAERLLNGLKDVILTLLGGIVTAITGMTGDFIQIGTDLVVGLWRGIVDRWNQLKEDVGNLFSGLISWIKGLLGIASPSRVTIEIGYDLMRGLVVGIEGAMPDALRAIAESIDAIIGTFQNMASLLANLAAPPPPVDWTRWADAFSEAINKIMDAVAGIYDQPGGPKADAIVRAKDLAPQLEAIMGIFSTLVELLKGIATLENKIPPMGGFRDALVQAVNAVLDAIGSILKPGGDSDDPSQAVARAAVFSQAIQQILSLIQPAVDAIAAMATYTPLENLPERMTQWRDNLFYVVYSIVEAAKFWQDDALVGARGFSAAASEVLAVVTPAVEAIQSIAEYEPVKDLPERMLQWRDNLFYIVYAIVEAAKFWQDEALTGARVFAAAAQEILGLIQPAVEAIAAMADFEVVQDLAGRMWGFKLNLIEVVLALRDVAEFFVGALDDAVGFSQAASEIVALVGPAVDAINKMLEFSVVQDLAGRMWGFKLNLIEVILALKDVAEFFVGSLDDAIAFSESAGRIIALIEPAIEAIRALFAFENIPMITKDLLDSFVNWMETVIYAIVLVAERFQGESAQEGLGAARIFSVAAQEIVALISPAIEAITGLLAYEGGGVTEAFGVFRADFEALIDGLVRLVNDLGTTGLAQARQFEEIATAVAAAIRAGTDTLGSVGEEGASTAIGGIGVFVRAITEGMAGALNYLTNTFLPAWESDWARIAAAIRPAIKELQTFDQTQGGITVNPALKGQSPPPLAQWMTYIADATKQAAENMLLLARPLSRPLALATVAPRAPMGASMREAMSYQLTYVDQRATGLPPDLVGVAETLEWRARMRR